MSFLRGLIRTSARRPAKAALLLLRACLDGAIEPLERAFQVAHVCQRLLAALLQRLERRELGLGVAQRVVDDDTVLGAVGRHAFLQGGRGFAGPRARACRTAADYFLSRALIARSSLLSAPFRSPNDTSAFW